MDTKQGGWQSPETLQKHYNALHQGQDWAKILTTGASSSTSGETVEEATTSCFSACGTPSIVMFLECLGALPSPPVLDPWYGDPLLGQLGCSGAPDAVGFEDLGVNV